MTTNSRLVAKPRDAAEALAAVRHLMSFLVVLPVPVRSIQILLDLLQRHPVNGADVFDLQLVATTLANDVRRIYTFNTADFEHFGELNVVKPTQVM